MYDFDHRGPAQALLCTLENCFEIEAAARWSRVYTDTKAAGEQVGNRPWTRLKDDTCTATMKPPLLQEHPCYTKLHSLGSSRHSQLLCARRKRLGRAEGCKSKERNARRRKPLEGETDNIRETAEKISCDTTLENEAEQLNGAMGAAPRQRKVRDS